MVIEIRKVQPSDYMDVCVVEESSFSPEEAASYDAIRDRIKIYPECFQVAVEDGRVVGHINGLATDQENLQDKMYADALMHDPQGKWQMIFSVAVLPEYRRHHVASKLMEQMIALSRGRGRTGQVLTCKESLILFYARFGFQDEGRSASKHGGVVWHQMRLKL